MAPQSRQITAPLLIDWRQGNEYGHCFGGNHLVDGAHCPNCRKPLLLHLSLNLDDPLLGLKALGIDRLRLFYCMRCALCWDDFSYRIVNDNSIEILRASRGETQWNDWDADVGVDEFPSRQISLYRAPSELQRLCDKLNSGNDLSQEEKETFASITGNYASAEVGAYPCVDTFNQIGGRSFLSQRLEDPPCPYCAMLDGPVEAMYFLASLTNVAKENVRVSYEGVQIIFFLCPRCATVNVVHSV